MFGINLNSVLPARKNAEEQSEMVTQLLFGEHFEILENENRFSKIKNFSDEYCGWVDTKMITPLEDSLAEELSKEKTAITNRPIVNGYIESRNEQIIIPGGSRLPFYNIKKESVEICGETFIIPAEQVNLPDKTIENPALKLVSTAFMYLNSPYLWGGKNVLGIDCSGLVQVGMNICGKSFPRDASQQVNEGATIHSLSEAITGDLAFFQNENGKTTHVGILMDDTQIIHASGHVKIETITNQGIINQQSGKQSHILQVIKRIF